MAKKSTPKSLKYRCEYCDERFKWKYNLQAHQRNHKTCQKEFKCPLCTHSTSYKASLDVHIRSHTREKPFKCLHENCSSSFAQKSQLKTHEQVHAKGRDSLPTFPCLVEDCSYKTNTKYNLKHHSLVHSDARPFACSLCPYRAKLKSRLGPHQQSVHSREKPLQCPESDCNYFCARNSDLTGHMKIHSDEWPFTCSVSECPYKSKTRTHMKRHLRVHSGEKPFKCSLCPLSFANRGNLTVHIRGHTGETPYSCQKCPFEARTSNYLARHVKTWHSGVKTRKSKFATIKVPTSVGDLKCTAVSCGYTTNDNARLAIHLNKVHNLPRVVL